MEELIMKNKIYARTDTKGIVIKLFSNVFEQPEINDIVVDSGNEQYHAHVHLKYKLLDEHGKYNYKVVDNVLVELTDEEKIDIYEIKKEKFEEISNICKNVIYGGFTSNAYQGVEKTYGTSAEDQLNITGNALSATSKESGISECADDVFYYHASGEDFVEWTASECLQLARDFKGFKESILFKSKMLQSYIDTLTKSSDILSVNWDTIIPTV